MGPGGARPLLLRARPHRPGPVVAAAPLHRARLGARARALARRGHRRGRDVVPGPDRDRRDPGHDAPALAPRLGLAAIQRGTRRQVSSLKRSNLPKKARALKTAFGGLVVRISPGYLPNNMAA